MQNIEKCESGNYLTCDTPIESRSLDAHALKILVGSTKQIKSYGRLHVVEKRVNSNSCILQL